MYSDCCAFDAVEGIDRTENFGESGARVVVGEKSGSSLAKTRLQSGRGYVQAIAFNFREGLSREEQESVLGAIRQWPTIKGVGRLSPRSTNHLTARMCMAYVVEDAAVESVVESLDAVAQIENVEVPATRTLVR